MQFKATTSTDDGRLTQGKIYEGGFSLKGGGEWSVEQRIVVFDNKAEWMTFDPKVFVPAGFVSNKPLTQGPRSGAW